MPPLCSKAVFERHLQVMDEIVLRKSYEIVLLGDYNLSSVLCPVSSELLPNIDNVNSNIIKENTGIVCDFLQQYKLLQQHPVLNMESQYTLDLIFSTVCRLNCSASSDPISR